MEKLEFVNNRQQKIFDAILEIRPGINYQTLQTTLRKKDIKVNKKRISNNIFINIGDIITVFLPEKQKQEIEIIYQDENIIIANKPQGMETTKKDKVFDGDCLEDCLEGCYACHRLDKNTAGIVVLAKNTDSQQILEDAFKHQNIKKNYKAIVTGKVNTNGANLTDYLIKLDNIVKVYSKKVENSKIIKTNYRVIDSKNELYLLDIELLTGRTHQIRAHLQHHGIFILGDEKYGNKEKNKLYKLKKQQLVAYKIFFDNLSQHLSYLNKKTFEIKNIIKL